MFQKILSALVITAALFISSCDKDEKKPEPEIIKPSWIDYKGTAPFSAEIDGTEFIVNPQTGRASVTDMTEEIQISGSDYNKEINIGLIIPKNTIGGQEYELNGLTGTARAIYQFTFSGNDPADVYQMAYGKCFIIQNTSSVIEGYFYFDIKNRTKPYPTVVIKKGYFKMNK